MTTVHSLDEDIDLESKEPRARRSDRDDRRTEHRAVTIRSQRIQASKSAPDELEQISPPLFEFQSTDLAVQHFDKYDQCQ